ncbi:MAG: hypothetical protein RLZZ324_1055 [Candidatus Parcubacteria bacterium]|jgi:glycosyltransferase involved in cell wall biosynthesis
MKRIAIDIRSLLEPQPGGVSTYARELTRALCARGEAEHVLFSNAWKGNTAPARDFDQAAERAFFSYPSRFLNAGFRLGWPRLETLIGDFDALWMPNLNFMSTRKPYAVTVHDLSFMRHPRFFTAKQRAWHAAVGVRGLVRGAAQVIAVSEHTKSDVMEEFGVAPERVTVVTPAAAARYAPAPEDEIARVRAAHGLGTAPYFLFLGAIEPRKNVRGLIEAYERCATDADLVIAGPRGWLCEDVFVRAARSPKRDRIRFLGAVAEADKPALYSGAIAFTYPSFYEGFGMPPLEAMACGTPVVTSRVSSLGEVVGDAGLLADPHDAQEIAAAMDAAANDRVLRTMLRERGLARARGFTWEKSAETLGKTLLGICR